MADDDAWPQLEAAFAAGTPSLIPVRAAGPWAPVDALFLDMDGVLTRECDYFERAWALLIRQTLGLDPGAVLADVSDADLVAGRAFRARTKGGVPSVRIALLLAEYAREHPQRPCPSVDACRATFYGAVQALQIADFGGDWEGYLLPGARALLEAVPTGCRLYLVTANEQPQAEWVTEQVGIARYFAEVIGYPTAVAATPGVTKATIIADALARSGVPPARAAFIGDGVSDVRFGQEVGVRTVGVANDAANARALLGQGPDLVVCRTADLVPHMDVVLGRGGSDRPGPGG